jgi:flavorubredoxin
MKLVKVIIVYDSKYGNTKIAAEKISEGLRTVKGIEVELEKVDDVDIHKITDYDLIVIGSPNHIGGPTRGIKKFIDKLSELDLKNKATAAFDTYIGKDFQKTVRKIEEKLTKVASKLKILSPGLSIRVKGMKGPIVEDELVECEKFGSALAEKVCRL